VEPREASTFLRTTEDGGGVTVAACRWQQTGGGTGADAVAAWSAEAQALTGLRTPRPVEVRPSSEWGGLVGGRLAGGGGYVRDEETTGHDEARWSFASTGIG
jgi:hypothetical protein